MKIGTHNGNFQADDVFAVAALIILHSKATVMRTRNEIALAGCDIVVDVGGKYDHETWRYDHHQEGRAGARDNGILYSAFGLVWKHFGDEVVGASMPTHLFNDVPPDFVANEVDRRFVQAVDALDNGQAFFEGGPVFDNMRGYSLSSAITSLNPTWAEGQDYDGRFQIALNLAGALLKRVIAEAYAKVKAEEYVRGAIEIALDPRIIVLGKGCPWQDIIINEAPGALYVVFPYEAGGWMCQCVPAALGSFEKRKALPEAWAGKRDEKFQQITDVSDGIFCHPARFVCGAQSEASAIRLAKMAADYPRLKTKEEWAEHGSSTD